MNEVNLMTFKDWISYLIKQLNWYVETPKSERKQLKHARHENWSMRWFGMLPFSMKMTLGRLKHRISNRK